MNTQNTKIVNGANPSIIWSQYMDFLAEYGKSMKATYTKRMRGNSPITWSELDAVNKQIHDKLDYLMTWSEKFNQNNSTQPQGNSLKTQAQNSNGVAQQNIQGESKLHKGKVRLTESQLHNVIKESIRRILKEQNQPIARDFLDYELEEAFFADETGDTYWGGLSHNGETLQDFIDSLSDSGLTYDTPMSEINKALRECNIKPIKY